MSVTTDIEIQFGSLEDQHGVALASRQRDELLEMNPEIGHLTTDVPIFIFLLRDGVPLACGGLRLLQGETHSIAEVKRIYVIPEARGHAKGVSDLLMRQLELHALERGWTTLRLQTGTTMLRANKFYERHGYALIPNYGDYDESDLSHTISYEKVLGWEYKPE